jgi:hypothetical protein
MRLVRFRDDGEYSCRPYKRPHSDLSLWAPQPRPRRHRDPLLRGDCIGTSESRMRVPAIAQTGTVRRQLAPPTAATAADEFTDAYLLLRTRLDVLRTVLADRRSGASVESVRRNYRDLDQCLREALTNALGADAVAAPTPDGIKTWIGEGMARSLERELAMFADIDLGAAAR